MKSRRTTADELQAIPGVGPSIARELRALGIRRVAQLRGRNPQQLYERLIRLRGAHQDRCVLYVFRCAVYFARTERPRRELTRWWNWSDARLARRRVRRR